MVGTGDSTFYLGPLGNMVPLPIPESVERPVERIQHVSQGASGKRTVNVSGMRRTWSFEYTHLLRSERELLAAFHTGVIRGPLYLRDPFVKNLLPPRVAAPYSSPGILPLADGLPRGVSVFATPVAGAFPHPLPPPWAARIASGAPAVDGDAFQLGDVPVPIQLDQELAFSGLARTSAPVTLIVRGQDGTSGDWRDLDSASIAAGAELWQRFAIVVDTADMVALAGVVRLDEVGSTTDLAQLQLELGTVPSEWVPGEGVPAVEVDTFPESSPLWPYTDGTLTLVEL